MNDPAGPRRGYAHGHLDDDAVAATWLEQLRGWFDEAMADPAIPEANAIQLATMSAAAPSTGSPAGPAVPHPAVLHPAVRTVLVKALDERGIVFYTNYDSAKAQDLSANPYAAAVFVWKAHERQVRLSGPVAKVSREETAAYFASRPRESQIGAWASPQSQVVASRAALDATVAQVARRFGDGPIPAPPHWGGYRLAPDAVEFWQGRPGRVHDRIRFRRDGDGADGGSWRTERLAP